MNPSRLRSGEIMAAFSAVALLLLLGFEWFSLDSAVATVGASATGYGSLGWFADALLISAALSAIALAVATAAERAPAVPVALEVMTVVAGLLATICLALRLIFQPTLNVGADDTQVDLLVPAYLGFAAAFGILAGAWRALADERTDSTHALEQTERVLGRPGVDRAVPGPRAMGESEAT